MVGQLHGFSSLMPLRVSYCTVLMPLHVLRSSQLSAFTEPRVGCWVWGPGSVHPAECSVPYDVMGQQGRYKH